MQISNARFKCKLKCKFEKANLKRTLTNAINDFKNRDQKSTKSIAMIVLILVFIFLFIIDFDLTIFFN